MRNKELLFLIRDAHKHTVEDLSNVKGKLFYIEEYEPDMVYVFFAIHKKVFYVLRVSSTLNTNNEDGLDVGTWWKTYGVEDVTKAFFPDVKKRHISTLIDNAVKLINERL
jgi:hypothetical protein